MPAVDIHTLGAGGGSIAWIDAGGGLQVGPRSAGAIPGPVCYGNGGTEPTTTDAQLLLGRLNADLWRERYGWELDHAAAERAVEERIAAPLGISVVDAADAILRVTVNNLVQGIRLVSIERGYDPRTFALCPFGGAGPMYAVDVAQELAIPEIVVPLHPGVTSALGLLQVDLRQDLMRSALMVEGDLIRRGWVPSMRSLNARPMRCLSMRMCQRSAECFVRQADVRYFGQSKYITIPVEAGPVDEGLVARLIQTFSDEHAREYGYTMPPHIARIEIANVRLAAVGKIEQPNVRHRPPAGAPANPRGHREVFFGGSGFVESAIYWRETLARDQRIIGPAIIEQADSTTVIPPGWDAAMDDAGKSADQAGTTGVMK